MIGNALLALEVIYLLVREEDSAHECNFNVANFDSKFYKQAFNKRVLDIIMLRKSICVCEGGIISLFN